MADMASIRKQFPQYDDMSDEQLARAMHKKFYADMPFADFAGKIGFAPPGSEQEGAVDVPAAPAQAGMSWGDVAKGAAKNVGQSAVNTAKNIASPFVEAYQGFFGNGKMPTLDALGSAAHGLVQKTGILKKDMPDKTAYTDALAQAIVDRYGGVEAIKNTLATDPVGAVMDVMSVVQPVAGIADRKSVV